MMNKIIVAPLNWGLGHASRCVAIINKLLLENFIPIIASDGKSLLFLRQEFPDLEFLELPSYHISYGKNVKWSLFFKIPKILKAVKAEKKIINNFIKENKEVVGVISDNRFGVRSTIVPSIYITHQVNVFSGFTTFFTSKIHQKIINTFDECWVPDNHHSKLSGKLSQSKSIKNLRFIGVLSRFHKEETLQDINVLVLLSGPEPNRTQLEEKLISVFKNDTRSIVFVLGKVENHQKKWKEKNLLFYNFLMTKELQQIINKAKTVICRSGYSSIMDLAVLEKKVFFIPTKNQSEQEYLASYLEKNKLAPFCKIDDFTLEKVLEIKKYKGLKVSKAELNSELFCLFHRKRKL